MTAKKMFNKKVLSILDIVLICDITLVTGIIQYERNLEIIQKMSCIVY